MLRHPLPTIDAEPRSIELCEPRLALSASLAGEMLLEAFDLSRPADVIEHDSVRGNLDLPEPAEVVDSPDLLAQASDLRETRGLDGQGQTVAVIDSGVAWDHLALGGGYGPGYRVVGGWDFAEDDANPYDDGPAGYHGSHVSGLLAGQMAGFEGVAPGADLVALRVLDDSGAGQLQWIESALAWVHQNQDAFDAPITTVNLSIGTALNDANRLDAISMLEDELQQLRQDNILVFAASGNLFADPSQTTGDVLYPASSPSVVPVASVDDSGTLSSFSQRQAGILSTRGESISSAVPEHVLGWDGKLVDLASLDGTSMATPQVAGASMLVRQAMIDQGIDPTAEAILDRLRDSAMDQIDPVSGATYHTIDLQAATDPLSDSDSPTIVERFDGTNQSQRMELDLRDGLRLRVGATVYELSPADADTPLVIDAAGGDDSLSILGSDRAERLILRPGAEAISSLTTNDYQIELRGLEQVAFVGGGGPDRASIFDSDQSDSLTSHPGAATMTGIGFQFDVLDVPRVYVHGTAGGNDTAFLHDSAGDDALAVRPQYTSIKSDDSFQLAYGFERVYAYATAGGVDSAQLYDSAGDDTMSISAERSMISGPGYQVSTRGFDSTVGYAIAGGHDEARLYADVSSNQWHTSDDKLQWTGADGEVRIARGFERAMAFEQYRPIALAPQSASPSLTAWLFDTDRERAEREADASRAIFESFGRF